MSERRQARASSDCERDLLLRTKSMMGLERA
jgi:hypothetical protein